MWLVALVISATVSGESQEANSSSYLDAAVTGFDPFYMTALTQPNPGRRSKLFQPLVTLVYGDKTVLYSFVNEEVHGKYLPKITIQKVLNFNEYVDFTTSTVCELSSKADFVKPSHRYENYSSCKTKNHSRDCAMLHFFKNTGGEVLFAKTDVVTHTITISSFVITTFTPAFEKAVETLYKAAVNPVTETTKNTYNEFVRLYGTHFSRRTHLGSRAIFAMLFSTRSATVEEETARHRCVLEAVHEALKPCMPECNETTRSVFVRASVRCGGEENEPIVEVTGPMPERTLDDWASAAKNSPVPIFSELEPLSTLFTSDWFEDYFDGIQVRINGTILSHFFEENLADYRRRMATGGSNSSHHFRGCGLNSDCQIGTECRNEPGTESGFSCIPKEVPDAATASTTTRKTTTICETTSPAPKTTTLKPTRTPVRQCSDLHSGTKNCGDGLYYFLVSSANVTQAEARERCDRLPGYRLAQAKSLQTMKAIKNMWYSSNKAKPWRDDQRCGPGYPLEAPFEGVPSQCDPVSINMCCSDHHWCGNTSEHCACPGCRDFRRVADARWNPIQEEDGKELADTQTPRMQSHTHQNLIISVSGFAQKPTTHPPSPERASNKAKLWRDDQRCGPGYPLEAPFEGVPSQCDPASMNMCCSDHHWCGNTSEHCACPGCRDFRGASGEAKLWRDDERCGPGYPLEAPFEGVPSQCNPASFHMCCSDLHWCGNTSAHCSCTGCRDYSRVDGTPRVNSGDFWIDLITVPNSGGGTNGEVQWSWGDGTALDQILLGPNEPMINVNGLTGAAIISNFKVKEAASDAGHGYLCQANCDDVTW